MPARHEVAYFGAGPAPLPTNILEEGARDFVNFENTGISLAELSHRSPTANRILADAKAGLTQLLGIPDDYEIIFCHGGGTGGFASVVFNMLAVWIERRRRRAEAELGSGKEAEIIERVRREIQSDLRLDYLITGSWSLKGYNEAINLTEPLGKGFVNAATDSRKLSEGKFRTIADESTWNLTRTPAQGGPGSAYVYLCDNETVDGVEFPSFPKSLEPQGAADPDDDPIVVADMSSNFLSRAVDVSKYGIIFGGAQKNIGITDTTIVIIRKRYLTLQPPAAFLHACGVWSPPSILHFPTLAKNNSLYNTLPIFSLHIAARVMAQSLATHGALATGRQAAESAHKAALIYDVLDAHPQLFAINPTRNVRSRMNICFRIGGPAGDDGLEKRFLAGAEQRGLLGLKGHRSVGGIRVSNYNAVGVPSVEKLRDWLLLFVKEVGTESNGNVNGASAQHSQA